MHQLFRLTFMCVSLAIAPTIAMAKVVTLAHYHLKEAEGAIRDVAAPAQLASAVEGGPALQGHGQCRVMSSAPAIRSSAYSGSVKFDSDQQCYETSNRLVAGDNWLVEAWVYASSNSAPGLHAAVANGNGAHGFLIAQVGDRWQLFVGGVGGRDLGPVQAERWTHIAIVRDKGRTSGWVDGQCVDKSLPTVGSGAANFSIGATAPGKEAFQGWVAEVRVARFERGEFDPTEDLLLDNAAAKKIGNAGSAAQAQKIQALTRVEGVEKVGALNEHAYPEDWLIAPPQIKSSVQVLPNERDQSAQILLTNGLVSRTFCVVDDNLGCISFRRADKDLEFVRAIKPEARICLNGKWLNVGGLEGTPDRGFISPSWLDDLYSPEGGFHFTSMTVGACVKPYHWQPKCNAPAGIAWPANGRRVTFHFQPSAALSAEFAGVSVDIHYEIYDGLPVIMKSLTVQNHSEAEVVVTRLESEYLAVQPTVSQLMHVESDYSCAAINWRETSSGLGIHANGARAPFRDYYVGGGTTRFVRDPNWGSMATLNPAEDIFLGDIQNALLVSAPPTGPHWPVGVGESFHSFRTFELLNDSTERERRFLAQRRFYRKLAPQTNEKQFEVHAPSTRDMRTLAPLLDQMHEVGFDLLQAPEHPGSFNYVDTSPSNIQSMKAICDYARQYGIRVGAYQLMMASQGWGKPEDNYNCIDPTTGKPGSMFGQSACGASAWADMYFANMWTTIEAAGMTAFKPDGPYHGDCCAATSHPHHRGLADSQWAQWKWMCGVLAEGQRRNLYLSIPDWYFLNGQVCTGMGYREATDNLEIGLQTVLYRQYIFDATWHKTAQMGWVNLNTETLHGGMEKNLEKYERVFFTMLSSGAQVWIRGNRLYDGPESKAMLQKWMAWYKKHEEVILGDIIHLRRPDGRGLDYMLHVNPDGNEKGMLLVFNPLDRVVTKTIDLPLYYAGLSGVAHIQEQDGESRAYKLDGRSVAHIEVTIPANGFSWYVIQ